jgi:hypothetical protein
VGADPHRHHITDARCIFGYRHIELRPRFDKASRHHRQRQQQG